MRDVEIRAKWLSAERYNRTRYLARVVFENVAGLGSGAITFAKFLTVITGGNGVGKSTLLQLVAASLMPERGIPASWRERLRGARAVADVIDDDTRRSFIIALTGDSNETRSGAYAEGLLPSLPVVFLDPGEQVRLIKEWASVSGRVIEQLPSYEPISLTRQEVEMLSRVARKTYRSVNIYEIDGVGDEVFPYIVAEEDWPGAPPYGSEHMGSGELRIHVLCWALRRAANGTLFIVDEADALLAEISQGALLDAFAVASAEKGLTFILASHSSRTIFQAPRNCIRVLTRGGGDISVIDPATISQAIAVLGATKSPGTMVLCEDIVAREVAQELLNASKLDLAADVEIMIAGSAAEITRYRNNFPKSARGCRIIGLYDGDMGMENAANWPGLLLPGPGSPEIVIRAAVEQDINEFAERLARPADTIRAALAASEGSDPHDWIYEFAKHAASTRSNIISAAMQLWIVRNQATHQAFCEEMARLLTDD